MVNLLEVQKSNRKLIFDETYYTKKNLLNQSPTQNNNDQFFIFPKCHSRLS